jgi:hypothetical protein
LIIKVEQIKYKEMTNEDFSNAVALVSETTNIKVAFNVPVSDSISNVHKLLILESNATIIRKLIEAGYSLSMCAKGLVVDKF